MFRKKIQIYGLVSPSSDGAWLAEILGAIGIKAIRGSSKRNGISAISTIVQKLREGACVTITPDGPRGPINKFKNGAAMVAQRAESNVVAFAFGYGCHISLSTWDRFKIPLPFSRIRVGGKMLHFSDFASLPTKKITEMFEAEMELLQSKLQ
jgi:lysophospholipid acyltransferase (LPLAT)-like uncharacterized protein